MRKLAYEWELMTLVLAVQKWQPYLFGRRFVIRTDQKSLKFFLDQRVTTPEQQRWLVKLLGFEFDIQYKLGGENWVADALSRRRGWKMEQDLVTISGPHFLDIVNLEKEVDADDKLRSIKTEIIKGDSLDGRYSLQNGVLFRGKIIIPAHSQLK